MKPLLLGIDVGTSALKAAVVARSGECIGSCVKPLDAICGADGAREQDSDQFHAALTGALGQLRAELGRAWQGIEGIGLAAQGGSAMLAERNSGRALTPMQLWNDTRPLALLPDIAAQRPDGYWRRLTHLEGPGAGLARIRWLQQRHPEFDGADRIYVGAGEYLFHRLTDVWRQDAGNALQIGCYDVAARCLVEDPLATVGVGLDFVAPLRQGHERHGLSRRGAELTGLPPGIPVVGPYIDHEAGFLAAAEVSSAPLQCSLGTAWVGNFLTPDVPRDNDGMNLILPSPTGAGFLVLRVMRAGNATWDWALETFADSRDDAAFAEADAIFSDRLLPPDGLCAFPWLTRPNSRVAGASGNAAFIGLGAHATRHDLLRAVAAGMAFEFASLFRDSDAAHFDAVVLTGGASRGACFRKLLTALFAPTPVFRCLEPDIAGARGALHAFGAAASRARVEPLPAVPDVAAVDIERQYRMYLAAAGQVWSDSA